MSSHEGDSPVEGGARFARALHDMAQRYEHLVQGYSMLRQVDAVDNPALELDEVCLRLLEAVAEGISAENCSLMLVDETGIRLELRAAASFLDEQGVFFGPGFWSGKSWRVGEGLVGRVAAEMEPLRVDDATEDVGFVEIPDSPVTVRSLMCFPLSVEGRLIGVLNMSHSRRGFFSVESEHILSLVAGRVARLLASHMIHHERRQSAEYYRLVCENAADIILAFNGEDRIVNANPAASQVTGIPLSAFLEGNIVWSEYIHPDDREVYKRHRAAVTQARERHVAEYRFLGIDGTVHYFEDYSSPVGGVARSNSGVVSVIRDVTERKRSEEEKLALEEQLRHAQKMQAVGELAGGIAHDFNNLLTGVLGNVSLARAVRDEDKHTKALVEAEKAAKRAAALVKQLLILSRRSAVDIRPVDPSEVLYDLESMIRNTFDRRIEISVSIEPDVPSVMADPGQLHQVLLNLCVNARDALLGMSEGDQRQQQLRISLTAGLAVFTPAQCAGILHARPGRYACISVRDTGPGMDEETQTRAFEPFFTTKGPEQGTGLGLAIVYGIVHQHGGWVHLDTAPGRGAAFTLYLPAARNAAAAGQQTETEPPPLAHGTETILLVDDEEVVRQLAVASLEPLGYTVLLAEDGEKGWKLFQKRHSEIALVILDLSMPHLPGDEVLRRMRDLDPAAKIVVSSGYATSEPDAFRPPYTPTACLRKPYTHQDIANMVRKVLDTNGQVRE